MDYKLVIRKADTRELSDVRFLFDVWVLCLVVQDYLTLGVNGEVAMD